MKSSGPGPYFEIVLLNVQHVCGIVLFAFNSSILFLIVRDNDTRGQAYRKYTGFFQVISMTIDTVSDFYAPMFLANRGVIYSNSWLSRWVSACVYWDMIMLLVAEIGLAYLLCVYYRRCSVLPPTRRFIYFGWKRNLLYTTLHAIVLTATCVEIYFMQKLMESSEKSPHSELDWLRGKTSFFVMQPDANLVYAHCLIVPVGYGLVIATVAMLTEIVKEVKKRTHWTSRETQRYQRIAVRTLVLQGTLPSLGYLVPGIIFSCIQFAPMFFKVDDDFEQIASMVSPILYVIISKHTFFNSLTILYCSRAYRQKIVAFITNSRVSEVKRISENETSMTTRTENR